MSPYMLRGAPRRQSDERWISTAGMTGVQYRHLPQRPPRCTTRCAAAPAPGSAIDTRLPLRLLKMTIKISPARQGPGTPGWVIMYVCICRAVTLSRLEDLAASGVD